MYKELNNKQYNIAIGLILLWGFAINAIMCTFFQNVFVTWNPTIVIIGYFVVAIIGICMSKFSDNPIVTFIGYNFVVLPVGVVLSISVKDYYVASIVHAFMLTTLITILMLVISTFKPEVFKSIESTLFVCVLGVIAFELVIMIVGIVTPQWWDWLIALLFCGYIGYDWSKAQEKRKTINNAIDSAVGLYLDIINIFVRFLVSSKDND